MATELQSSSPYDENIGTSDVLRFHPLKKDPFEAVAASHGKPTGPTPAETIHRFIHGDRIKIGGDVRTSTFDQVLLRWTLMLTVHWIDMMLD